MSHSIQVFAPATVANVACGFDILGFALEAPGDVISVSLTDAPGMSIQNQVPGLNMPLDPAKNTTTVAIQAYVEYLQTTDAISNADVNLHEVRNILSTQGIAVTFYEKIKPGSGVGSSSASAAAGVFGLNELLGRPLTKLELVQFAMQGERAACGAAHADNVAPAILGGFVLVRSYTPLDIVTIPYPAGLCAAIIHPQIEVRTEDARKVLRKEIKLKDAIQQWGNIAGLIAGLMKGDHALIGRSLQDVIIEPVRSLLIPGYDEVKQAAMDAGALGCSISGSGPSMFALCQDRPTAEKVSKTLAQTFDKLGIDSHVYVSGINAEGVRVV